MLFMFPGQGAQHSGMGYELCNQFQVARRTLEEAEDVLNLPIRDFCFDKVNKQQLNETANAQFSVFAVSVAAYRVLYEETGIVPQLSMGHSLGELTALTCAGAVDYQDMLVILRERSKIIQGHINKNNGTMMWVVNLNSQVVEDVCKEQQSKGLGVFISGINSPEQVAISGENGAMMKTARKLERMGAIVYPLNMEGPFHSKYMQEAADEFKNILNQYSFKPFRYQVMSIMTALPYTGMEEIADTLSGCLAAPVRWTDCIQYAIDHDIHTAIEIGAKNILSFLMMKNTDKIITCNVHVPSDLEKVRRLIQEHTA
ncbi:hypothetical protein PMSD_25165 [Paenibacillus macquariensis subsp. defensor]|nr:hypothetical protein PMSD_25165 [Paenibacillus macquariensis subsp. defensor]